MQITKLTKQEMNTYNLIKVSRDLGNLEQAAKMARDWLAEHGQESRQMARKQAINALSVMV